MSSPAQVLVPEPPSAAVAGADVAFGPHDLLRAVRECRQGLEVIEHTETAARGVRLDGGPGGAVQPPLRVIAVLPALYPEWLGDRAFGETHGVRFPYVAGEMANGIATARMVIEMARAGFLGFFGAAGLSPSRVEANLDEIARAIGQHESGGLSWGSNLIHSPNEPSIEEAIADLYIRRGVARVSASAYMGLTAPVVRYAVTGLRRDSHGRVVRRHHLFAKISRPEVARRFLEPAPAELLDALVSAGQLTREEAELALRVPVAEDITVESDSGGHTDNRPLAALLPTICSLRDQIAAERRYERAIRVGAAGGLGTPSAVAAAFALGASYVLTGSINQACAESGLCADGRAMLAAADLADVVMAPAADMFELGVKVQVLKRGTMFGVRAKKLYDLYREHDSLEAIPGDERARLERDILRATIEQAWTDTRAYWTARDASEVARAEREPKHRMALVFRSYLGLASRWAIDGRSERRLDYQIWCGPAMGAFNAWTRGSFLAAPESRGVVQVARNLMEGAAVITRAQQLRSFGVPVPAAAFDFRPRPLR